MADDAGVVNTNGAAGRGGERARRAVATCFGWPTDERRDSRVPRVVAGKRLPCTSLGPAFIDEGTVVYKVGRTTGPTRGRVTAFDLDNLVVKYDIGNLRFDGQIEIEDTGTVPFSDGGDSGSLIVSPDMRAVALLFAEAIWAAVVTLASRMHTQSTACSRS